MGYSKNIKGYRLWCLDSKSLKIFISRDDTFYELTMLKAKDVPPRPTSKKDEMVGKVEFEISIQEDDKDMSH